jgi:nucleoside-diphosphate-sugar epimerase
VDQTSVLLISAEDTDQARLLTRRLLERGSQVGVLSPVPFPEDKFPGVRLIDAKQFHSGELEAWFRQRPYAAILDLGAFRPESIALLRRLHAQDIDQYIFCSSVGVYASGLSPPVDESSPFAEADSEVRSVERYLAEVRAARAFPVTVVRSSPVYGEGRGLLAYFFDRILFGNGVLCPRPLEDSFQPLYVGDWIECLVGLVGHPRASGEVFNLVGAEWTTLGEFLEQVAAAAYATLRAFRLPIPELTPEQLAELDPFPLSGEGHQLFSGLKLLELCGLEARTPLAVGLEQGFIRYLEQAGEIPEPNLRAETRWIEALGLTPVGKAAEPEAPAVEPQAPESGEQQAAFEAGKRGAPSKLGLGPPPPASRSDGAGQMGAPTRLGPTAGLGPIRRRRDPSELPPPPSVAPEILEQKLDSMVDLMLSGVNREGENELQVEMKDEVLGGLHIKIAQKLRHIRASFGCKQRESRPVIEENLPQLRRKLEARGYFVTELVTIILR